MATVNSYNVGSDLSFVITDDLGDVFVDASMGFLEDFETHADDNVLKITPITTGGRPIYQTIWDGGNGRLSFTRFGPSFQQMFMDLQSAYHGSGIIPQFSMLTSVRNRDGSIDEVLYDGVQFSKPGFGSFHATREVKMPLMFNWSTCKATGTLNAFLSAVAQAA